MTTPRLFRVIVPVDDLETCARFYATLLDTGGMRVSAGRHYFMCGGVILAVYDPRAEGDAGVPRPNFEHVYFAVPDLESVFAVRSRLEDCQPRPVTVACRWAKSPAGRGESDRSICTIPLATRSVLSTRRACSRGRPRERAPSRKRYLRFR